MQSPESNYEEKEEEFESTKKEQTVDSPFKDELRLDDLEQAVKIYDDFRAYSKKAYPSNDKKLESEFELKMSEMANRLKDNMESDSSSEFKNACILKTRSDILDITFRKMIAIVPDYAGVNTWLNILKEYNSIVQSFVKLVSHNKIMKNTDNDV